MNNNISKILEASNLVIRQYDRLKKEQEQNGNTTRLDYLSLALELEDKMVNKYLKNTNIDDLYDELSKIIDYNEYNPYTYYEDKALVRLLGIIEYMNTDYEKVINKDSKTYILINYINYLKKINSKDYYDEKYNIIMFNPSVEGVYLDSNFKDIDLLPTIDDKIKLGSDSIDVFCDVSEQHIEDNILLAQSDINYINSVLELLDSDFLDLALLCLEKDFEKNSKDNYEVILDKVKEMKKTR